MRSRHIRSVIFMAVISIAGIMVMQFIWFQRAYDLKQRQFNHTVFLALQNVADKIQEYNKVQVPLVGTVNQISTNYYAVNINGEIETNILEFFLKNEFSKRNIRPDFEYGVYNCETGRMVYGNYISQNEQKKGIKRSNLPIWKEDKYYFTVMFPKISLYLTSQLGIWLFFNGVLLIICFFFAYTLMIILKQKRLSEVQKDFINNMTHELKTPVSTIQVTTGLIKKEEIIHNPELITNYLGIIQGESQRLKNQVDKVLQIAQLEKEKIKLNIQQLDIHEHITDVAESATLLIEEKEGRLMLQLNAENSIIKADAVHIANVLHNLIDNAVKYCHKKPEIIISTTNSKKHLMVSIKDNGIGVSNNDIKKIFDKFYRVPTGNIHNVKGYGLGLFYVKTIIERLNGKLTMKSNENEGSEVIIYLPFVKTPK